ncbi:MAG: hypothetical protein ACSHXF_13470 [Aquaticitalea sp.]
MNRIRLIGLGILIAGMAMLFFLDSDASDFLSALLLGLGVGLVITGKVRKPIKNSETNA